MNQSFNAHNISRAVTITGDFSPSLLAQAMKVLIERHDILRTCIVYEGDEPQQVINAGADFDMVFHDVSDLPSNQRRQNIEQLTHASDTRSFDLSQTPLLSLLVIKLDSSGYLLHFNQHHIITDGWSQTLFYQQLLAIYDQLVMGGLVDVDKPKLSYHDYALWQKQWLDSKQADVQRHFWSEYLADSPPPFSLPIRQSRVNDVAHSNQHSIRLSLPVSKKLSAIAHQHKGSLFNVLHSAFALLMSRLSGESDFTIGIPVSGRHIYGTQDMLGMFINNLPVRHQLDLSLSFKQLLQQQIDNVEQVLSNQDIPFEQIIELSNGVRDADSTTLFQVFFNMLNLPDMQNETGHNDYQIQASDTAELDSKFDLTFYLSETADGVDIHCVFNRERYQSNAIEQLLAQYGALLTQVSQNIEQVCGKYSLNVAPVLIEHQCHIECYANKDVAQLFRQQAVINPSRVAVVDAQQQYSYQDVLNKSFSVAQTLQVQGIAKGDVVTIVAERGVNLIAAVYGVLHLGAIYSIVTTEMPVTLIEQQISAAQAKAVILCRANALNDATLLGKLTEQVLLIALNESVFEQVIDFIPTTVDITDAACITFTSGSTGKPKGIVGSHLGLSGYLNWLPQRAGYDENDRFSLLSGLVHDPIQRDIFGALSLGAQLMIPEQAVFDEYQFAQWLVDAQISVAHMTPAMVQLASDEGIELPSLRCLFLTGEGLKNQLAQTLLSRNIQLKLFNCFGTTETQRALTYHRVGLNEHSGALVGLSTSSNDTRLRIINEFGADCGVGEMGYIYTESAHLAIGYLADSELTEQCFSQAADGVRRYATGDLGYYLDTQRIGYVGRSDNQVSLRGFRIELAEIEHQLVQLAQVQSAVVTVFDDQLVAYVVTVNQQKSEVHELLSVLSPQLPNYMLPNSFVFLEALPLSPSGKVDKRALPAPSKRVQQGLYCAPQTDTEQTLVEIWAQLLKLEGDTISIDANFFELGGHSLLVLGLISQIKDKLETQLSVKQLFAHTSVRKIAVVIDYARSKQAAKDSISETDNMIEMEL